MSDSTGIWGVLFERSQRSRSMWSFAAVSLIALNPGVFAAFPWEINKIVKNWFLWFVEVLVTGLIDAVGLIFKAGVKMFLFYENPREIAALNWYWSHTLLLYLFIIFASMFLYFVVMMLLADTDDANVQRIVKRLIVSGFLLVISRDLFAFFVALTNTIIKYVYPQSYSFELSMNALETMVAIPSAAVATGLIAIIVGVGLALSAIVLFIVLAMRMLIIYVVYATLPVWIGFWVVDVGPAKYGKFAADLLFKITAMFMVVGILVAGIIAVGAGVGLNPGGDAATPGDQPVKIMEDGTVVSAADGLGIIHTEAGGVDASEAGDVIFRMWMYFAVIWLVIALMSSMFAVMLTAGSSSPGGTGGYSGYGSRSSGSAAGAGAGAGGAGNQAHMVKGENGRTYMLNEQGAGFAKGEEGITTFKAGEAPDSVMNKVAGTPENPPTLTEKSGYIADDLTGGKYSATKDKLTGAKESMTETLGESGRLGSGLVSAGNLARRGGSAYYSVLKQPTVGGSIAEARRIARASPIGRPNAVEEIEGRVGDKPASAFLADESLRGFEGYRPGDGSKPGAELSDESGFQKKTNVGEKDGVGVSRIKAGELRRGRLSDSSGLQSQVSESGAAVGQQFEGSAENVMSDDAIAIDKATGAPGSYDQLTDDEFIDKVYDVANDWMVLEQGMEEGFVADSLSRDEFKQHVLHQKQMGLSPEEAYKSAVETLADPAAEPLGQLQLNQEMIDKYGMDEIPPELSTNGAFKRVNMAKSDRLSGGTDGENMWEYQFTNGKRVYVRQDPTGEKTVNAKVGGDMMNQLSGRKLTGKKHYDAANNVVRAEEVKGESLHDVMNGNADISKDTVDKQSLVDAHAASGVVGDHDMHADNFKVSEKGQVRRIDTERSGQHGVDVVGDKAATKAEKHAKKLGADVSKDEVRERMVEMANSYDRKLADDVSKMQSSVGSSEAASEARKQAEETTKTIHSNVDKLKKEGKDAVPDFSNM